MSKNKSTELILKEKIQNQLQKAKLNQDSIKDFVENFLGHFISFETKRAYLKDLNFFFEYLKNGDIKIVHPRDIEVYHFQAFRDHLLEKGLTSATVNRRLVGIRSFMKWSLAMGFTKQNPLDAIKLPRIQTQNPTQALDDYEVGLILQQTDRESLKNHGHRLILLLLLHLGLRRSELIKIKIQDMFLERGHFVLKIMGKGQKLRLIPLPREIQEEISDYLKHWESTKQALGPKDYLIQSKNTLSPTALDGSTVYRIVQKYCKRAGINKNITPHSCRATVISHLLDTQQTPIRDVAIFAGHSNITTTERYDKRRNNLDKNASYLVNYFEKKIA